MERKERKRMDVTMRKMKDAIEIDRQKQLTRRVQSNTQHGTKPDAICS
jgi:hypothetical protein